MTLEEIKTKLEHDIEHTTQDQQQAIQRMGPMAEVINIEVARSRIATLSELHTLIQSAIETAETKA